MAMYGYCRVSTREQSEDRQVYALTEFGVAGERVYVDKLSGKDFNRPEYLKLIEKMSPGDVFVIKSIDRLGRDYSETLENWRLITKEKQCSIVVLDMPLLDTRKKDNRDLTGTFVADLVLNILSYVAETERTFIRQRQREGIEAAHRKGVKFGRPAKKRGFHWEKALVAWKERKISAREAGKILRVDHMTFLRWARARKEADKK